MKDAEEIMEILESFDLTQCYRAAGELAGCDHHTVAHWVARCDVGELTAMATPATPAHKGGEAPGLSTAQLWWPSPRSSDGRQRAVLVSATAQELLALDTIWSIGAVVVFDEGLRPDR
jgi:hypothetical protein